MKTHIIKPMGALFCFFLLATCQKDSVDKGRQDILIEELSLGVYNGWEAVPAKGLQKLLLGFQSTGEKCLVIVRKNKSGYSFVTAKFSLEVLGPARVQMSDQRNDVFFGKLRDNSGLIVQVYKGNVVSLTHIANSDDISNYQSSGATYIRECQIRE